jgi:hypothetical protein
MATKIAGSQLVAFIWGGGVKKRAQEYISQNEALQNEIKHVVASILDDELRRVS